MKLFFSILVLLSIPCMADQGGSQQIVDAMMSKISAQNFYCREKADALPGVKEFKERYADLLATNGANELPEKYKTIHFSKKDKKIIVERAGVHYLCQQENRQAISVIPNNLQMLIDLISQEFLAQRLLLISKNVDIYTYATTINKLQEIRHNNYLEIAKKSDGKIKGADADAVREIDSLENSLAKRIDELDIQNAALHGKKGVTCSVIGAYKVCYQ